MSLRIKRLENDVCLNNPQVATKGAESAVYDYLVQTVQDSRRLSPTQFTPPTRLDAKRCELGVTVNEFFNSITAAVLHFRRHVNIVWITCANCRVTNYELLRWLVETLLRHVHRHRMTNVSALDHASLQLRTVKVVVSKKRCEIDTLLLHTTNRKYRGLSIRLFPMTLDDLKGH